MRFKTIFFILAILAGMAAQAFGVTAPGDPTISEVGLTTALITFTATTGDSAKVVNAADSSFVLADTLAVVNALRVTGLTAGTLYNFLAVVDSADVDAYSTNSVAFRTLSIQNDVDELAIAPKKTVTKLEMWDSSGGIFATAYRDETIEMGGEAVLDSTQFYSITPRMSIVGLVEGAADSMNVDILVLGGIIRDGAFISYTETTIEVRDIGYWGSDLFTVGGEVVCFKFDGVTDNGDTPPAEFSEMYLIRE